MEGGEYEPCGIVPSSSSTYAPVPDPAGSAVFWVFPPRGTGAAADLEGGLRVSAQALAPVQVARRPMEVDRVLEVPVEGDIWKERVEKDNGG